ncbi:MAG: hypothetical protein VX353_07135 [Actinomycetota bacterium]
MIRPTTPTGKAMMQLLSAYTDYKDPLGPGVAIQRKGAVKDFFVESGKASFEVYDGRERAFDVDIHVSTASENIRRAVHSGEIQAAVPKVGEIQIHHVCPEWANPCRHEIAAFLQLVKEVDEDQEALLKWRGIGTKNPEREKIQGKQQSFTESEKKATIRILRNNLPGRFVKITDPNKSAQAPLNQEVINYLSSPQQVDDHFEHKQISQRDLQENVERKIEFDGFDIQPIITDAIETMSDFLLKN